MTFSIEKISEEDFHKSGLSAYSGKYSDWDVGLKWIIDRERNCFVIDEGSLRDEPWKSTYVYFYDHIFLKIRLSQKSSGHWNEPQFIVYSFDTIVNNPPEDFIERLRTEHKIIWTPLKEAIRTRMEALHSDVGCTVDFTF